MPNIELFLDYERKMLQKTGWGRAQIGRQMRISAATSPPGSTADGMRGVWQEVNTGVIMLEPTIRRVDAVENEDYAQYRRNLDAFYQAAWSNGENAFRNVPGSDRLLSVRYDGHTLNELGWVHKAVLRAMLRSLQPDFELAWVLETKNPLLLNEGFDFVVQPYGMVSDRGATYLGCMFGNRWFLDIRMNGSAALWEYTGDDAELSDESKWIERRIFSFAQGGVEHRRPFRVTVIPWGKSYISLLFTQEMKTSAGASILGTHAAETQFLVDIDEWRKPEYNWLQRQWVKVPPAPLRFAARRNGHQYDIQVNVLRYPDEQTFHLAIEYLEEPPTWIEKIESEAFGFTRQIEPGAPSAFGGGARIFMNDENDPPIAPIRAPNGTDVFDPAVHDAFVPEIKMIPSEGKVYTPELWHVNFKYPGSIVLAEDARDISANWTYIRIQKSAASEASVIECKLELPSELSDFYRLGGPVRVRASLPGDLEINQTIFEGFIRARKPNLQGTHGIWNFDDPEITSRMIVSEEFEGQDEWDTINHLPIGQEINLDKMAVGEAIKTLLLRGPYEEIDVVVDGDVNDLILPGKAKQGSLWEFGPDVTIGDAIRDILKRYSIQGNSLVRVRRVSDEFLGTMIWRVYLGPGWIDEGDDASPYPPLVFFLDRSLLEEQSQTDIERWQTGAMFIWEHLEPTVRRPNFNALFAFGEGTTLTSLNVSKGSLAVSIPPHPNVIGDKTAWEYEGQIRQEIVGPPVITAETMQELELQARAIYDDNYRHTIQIVGEGEWQPLIDADQLCIIVGRAPSGEGVSFGVYRIDQIDIEMKGDRDFGGGQTDRHAWRGQYSFEYVGRTRDDYPLPMFTDRLPHLVRVGE